MRRRALRVHRSTAPCFGLCLRRHRTTCASSITTDMPVSAAVQSVHQNVSHLEHSPIGPPPFYPPLRHGFSRSSDWIHLNTLGTLANMRAVAARLGVTVNPLDPARLADYGIQEGQADAIIDAGFIKLICDSADVVIVSDTVPDARPFLQSLLRKDPAQHCSAKIIIEATNRIDYDIKKDIGHYHSLLWNVTNLYSSSSTKHSQRVFWTANNPLEPMDMARESLAAPEWWLLRSTGVTSVPEEPVSETDRNLCLFKPHKTAVNAHEKIKSLNLPIKEVAGHGYGGPKTAAKYRCFIEIPYQVSVMKLYENLLEGVVMLVPSQRFFRELVENRTIVFMYWHKLLLAGDDWASYMDYYHPDLAPYLYYFDSWEHLQTLLSSPADIDTRNVRTAAPRAYRALVDTTVQGWARLFREMGFANVTVDGAAVEAVGGGSVDDVRLQPTLPPGIRVPRGYLEWKETYRGPLEVFKKTARKDAPPF
ncbi:hypothetical protein BC830DRAFT_470071 [Chytriomyces sp. MP71]|nr:hypothetical protein BC830DRAFT_470071 [Chytriomyces sp. MP71]